ncbi:Alpha/Beta hydrolase protein [Dactylonectria macrodidyma]|uniref:Alpha/Beta hydrolase protein n=1 Tax=Dactylonectria macrodidyma TaxID=307937 RepID=A0A9P9EHB5_9HYPO|nr:Alpha/Beta hydrolase protein [Dactylonectria macrodidyma]
MIPLSPDHSLHYEILRILSAARYQGADIGEVLEAASKIDHNKLSTFHDVFAALAERVNAQAQAIDSSKHPISARDAFFRAATYYRAADFFLHGNPLNPRINELWELQAVAFDKALALMCIPGKRITLRGDGFDVPAIYYAADSSSTPKPTFIIGTGYDGSQEELLHNFGFPALERGYNVITYEGPGQPLVRRKQNLGFIAEWEKVVTPVVDYLVTRPDVDASKIGAIGVSMGGWLVARAAAFEHRIAAAIAVDGVYDLYESYSKAMPPPMLAALESGEPGKVDSMVREALASDGIPIAIRWGIEQGLWSYNVDSATKWMEMTKAMTLKGIEHQIQCPIWVGEAESDLFFMGQPEQVRDALGDKATYVTLTSKDAAGNHCHVGAQVLLNQLVFDWFEDIVSK